MVWREGCVCFDAGIVRGEFYVCGPAGRRCCTHLWVVKNREEMGEDVFGKKLCGPQYHNYLMTNNS